MRTICYYFVKRSKLMNWYLVAKHLNVHQKKVHWENTQKEFFGIQYFGRKWIKSPKASSRDLFIGTPFATSIEVAIHGGRAVVDGVPIPKPALGVLLAFLFAFSLGIDEKEMIYKEILVELLPEITVRWRLYS